MFYMPDSLLIGRLGIGTKPSYSMNDYEGENQEDNSGILPPGQNSLDKEINKNKKSTTELNRLIKNRSKILFY